MENNKRRQPIYDNKNVINAGKFNVDNVNTINRRTGEMIYDSTLKTEEPKKKNPIVITAIISGILILIVCLFAFTDLKYLLFPKKEIVEENTDFEDVNTMHELYCISDANSNEVQIKTEKKYIYNNNKLKKTEYKFTLVLRHEDLRYDENFVKYIKETFEDIEKKYKNIKGIETEYSIKENSYIMNQKVDLTVVDRKKLGEGLVDVYLDQDIEKVKESSIREGLKCTDN